MIANFFSKSKPVNVFNVMLLLLFYYVVAVVFNVSSEFSLVFLLQKIGFFVGIIIFLMIANFIIKKNNLTLDNLYALLLMVILLGTFSKALLVNTIFYANFILLLSYRKIYSIKSGLNVVKKLFDAGFWIGIATIIYPNSIVFMLLIFIAIMIYQKTDFRNFVIPIIGLCTPLFLYFTYFFYFDNLDAFLAIFRFNFELNFTVYNHLQFLIPITFLITITLWSLVVVSPKIVLVSNQLRMSWNVLLNHLAVATAVVFIAPVKNGSELFFLLFPCTIIMANFLQKSQSSNFKNLILYIFFAISVSIYFL
jgi:hypothetical protein